MMMKPLTIFTAAVILSGCAAYATPSETLGDIQAQPAPPYAKDARGTACVAPGTWYDPLTKQTVPADQLIARMATKDVVLLGETHVVADHHRWQMQTIAQLYSQRPDMILGFEAFPRRVQGVLDRWVAGELSEQEFLTASDWNTVWKYDPAYYMPMFHFARLNRVPMVALNVDRALIREVSEKGWQAVPQALRRGIGDPAPASPEYLAMLGDVFGRHGSAKDQDNSAPQPPGLDNPMFANFVAVQQTWDRAMAEATATALNNAKKEGRNPRLVAIIGRGHMDHFYGVPEQLKDLNVKNVAVLTPWDRLRECTNLVSANGTPTADAVFGLEYSPDFFPPEKPKLGVMIEASDDGILVGKVLKDSIAEKAGLKKR
ncbi:MAG: ChaN family lipoprotein [Magnetovibrio sp.]|nr:ChaN family lipoprotein [Magnetovibrio sp.]